MTKQTLRVNPNTACKERVAEIRNNLPKNVRLMIMESHREYNTGEGSTLINNVLAGHSSDLKLTEILEKIAKKGGKK